MISHKNGGFLKRELSDKYALHPCLCMCVMERENISVIKKMSGCGGSKNVGRNV